ncbi:hypothetical protein MKX01_010153 [Papaver californicum]|nr:hypothetical protein MKX01_010153 [Papaver californicum]
MSNHIQIISFQSIFWFVPLFFIFGDSLVDVGNNNYLHTVAKANVEPYGIAYTPSGGRPTGQFCNGKTLLHLTVDEFGGSCYPPASLSLIPDEDGALCGVNIIWRWNSILWMHDYANTRHNLITNLGAKKATELLKNAVYPVVIGCNDFLDNFLTPIIGKRKYVPEDVFIAEMIVRHHSQLTRLHSLDARFIIVWNVPPIGCMPLERKMNPWYGGECADSANELVSNYNKKLKVMITELRPSLSEATLLYIDTYHVLNDILLHLSDYRYRRRVLYKCWPSGRVVSMQRDVYLLQRSIKYAFWDEYLPTEFVNRISLKRYMDGDEKDVLPFNIRRAMKLRGL